ncbi:hypothetical protein T12_11562 [Trichinella patagoniensis]|uniref:Uncharacterized protein n=1 Tax=Trichinella patagoniensis TaxID=990121 RepID=A0A0V0YW43_9BILA|nr:hypothetical protein T12_11562 [Trichinella patagoniensis]
MTLRLWCMENFYSNVCVGIEVDIAGSTKVAKNSLFMIVMDYIMNNVEFPTNAASC